MPIVNPDGFEGSRNAPGAPAGGEDEAVDDTAYIAARPGEYRRKNCRVGDTETASCPISVGLAENGVDPNRNYGQFWGGPGSDTNPATQTYRGPAPFSEPESRNIQWLVSRNQVMTLITNHTTAGLVLRAPGLAAIGDRSTRTAATRRSATRWPSTTATSARRASSSTTRPARPRTGATTPPAASASRSRSTAARPNYATGDCDKPAFHPLYATMVKEWDGTSAQADHVDDPGPNAGFDGKGNREAYYLAAESTINEARHSILEGTAPAGTRLRLTKDFKTETFEGASSVDDHLETVYDVGASGAFRWHVNPSTRPVVAKAVGEPERRDAERAAAGEHRRAGGDGRRPDRRRRAPGADANSNDPLNYNDHPFTIPPTVTTPRPTSAIQWPTIASDWDMRALRGHQRRRAVPGRRARSSAPPQQGTTDFEQITCSRTRSGKLRRCA